MPSIRPLPFREHARKADEALPIIRDMHVLGGPGRHFVHLPCGESILTI